MDYSASSLVDSNDRYGPKIHISQDMNNAIEVMSEVARRLCPDSAKVV